MSEEARFCGSCGARLAAGAGFCGQCGRPVAGQPAQEPPPTGVTSAAPAADYPVTFEVEYPEQLGRLSTFFRLLLAIPILIVLYLLGQGLIWAYWVGVLVRGRPVRWLFDANVAVLRFTFRSYAYFLLLTDRYPPFDGEWQVRYEVDHPERLSRWRLVIWKTVTVIPHLIVLSFLFIGVAFAVFLAWFAVLFTGRYPRGLHAFVTGSLRWSARVFAYWMSLTDEFPSFSLSADVGPAYFSTYVISVIFGWLIVLASIGGFSALIAWPGDTVEVTVSYRQLLQGEASAAAEVSDMEVTLVAVQDPYVFADEIYVPEEGDRFVLFVVAQRNERDYDVGVYKSDFQMKDSQGERLEPFLVTLGGLQPPRILSAGEEGIAGVMFEVDEDAQPTELKYTPSFGFKQRVKFILE